MLIDRVTYEEKDHPEEFKQGLLLSVKELHAVMSDKSSYLKKMADLEKTAAKLESEYNTLKEEL